MKRKIFGISLFLIFVIVVAHEIIPHHHEDNSAIEYFGNKQSDCNKQHDNNKTQQEKEEHELAFSEYFQKSSLNNVDIIRNIENSYFSILLPNDISVLSIMF